jgi:hypothetical protein
MLRHAPPSVEAAPESLYLFDEEARIEQAPVPENTPCRAKNATKVQNGRRSPLPPALTERSGR